MESLDYTFEMERSDVLFFDIDAHQIGVGGNNSWGATALQQYLSKEDRYQYSFRMSPIQ